MAAGPYHTAAVLRTNATLPAISLVLAACAGPDLVTHDAEKVRGRADGRLVATYAAGRETCRLAVPSGELTVDVLEVAVDARARTLEANLEWNNRSDQVLRVAVADLLLAYQSTPLGAKLPLDVEMPPLRPRVRQQTRLRFDFDGPPAVGIYTLTVRRVAPLDRALAIAIPVPGPR